ncbi:unnamed protein product, partial [Prorocentrum cordatum]
MELEALLSRCPVAAAAFGAVAAALCAPSTPGRQVAMVAASVVRAAGPTPHGARGGEGVPVCGEGVTAAAHINIQEDLLLAAQASLGLKQKPGVSDRMQLLSLEVRSAPKLRNTEAHMAASLPAAVAAALMGSPVSGDQQPGSVGRLVLDTVSSEEFATASDSQHGSLPLVKKLASSQAPASDFLHDPEKQEVKLEEVKLLVSDEQFVKSGCATPTAACLGGRMGGAKFPVEAEAPTEAAPPLKQASAMGTAAYDEDELREVTKGLSERQSLVLAVVDGIVEGNVDVSLSEVLRLLDGMGVVGLVCILSRAFSKNPQCLEELQYAFKQHSNSKGILLLMYEDFEMSPEMMFMIGRHSQAVVQPSVRTKCKCERRCECTGELLIRAREIAEDWLTGLRAGGFSMSFLNAMKKKKYARESTVSNDSTEEWNPKEVHQKLLQELTSDMKLKSINDLLGFVGIIGSTAFYNPASESICREIGVRLAGVLPETVAVCTGGFTGTGE